MISFVRFATSEKTLLRFPFGKKRAGFSRVGVLFSRPDTGHKNFYAVSVFAPIRWPRLC